MRVPIRLWFRRRLLPTVLALLVGLGGLGATAGAAVARDDTPTGPTPPRLGFVDGDVSFWRPGAEDWASAQVNTALAAGDSLYAGDGANVELQIGPRAFVRAGANSELGLESLEPGYVQFRLTGGHVALDLKRLARGQTVEIDTPAAAFSVDRPGYYRIDVDGDTSAFIARRGGAATVVPASGETVDVGEDQQVILGGAEIGQATVNAAPDPDAWDRWNHDRTAQLGETPRSAQYVPPDVAGVDELDRDGDWREVPQHGHVWVPRGVPSDWAPYSTGRWVYDPYYEWTWVDDAPWGWCPYHYGRWVYTGGFWGWAPGPIVATPVYAPALVAFFGVPSVGVSVGVGLPFVSWVALGFGEPLIPWWGGPRFVGRPYWGGWGGPRIVNNVVVSNTTIINVRNIRRFQNVNVHNAVMAVDRRQFGHGRIERVRLDPQRVQRLRPVRGDLGVKPVAASLVPNERRGRRPPEGLRARQVVATRPPQDPAKRLRAKGLTPAGSGAVPQPRIVKPRRGPQGRPGVEGGPGEGRRQPGVAPGATAPPPRHGERQQRGGGTAAPERATPPPPPRGERARPGGAGARQQVPPPPPHGERPRPGRSKRPESAAPQSPPGERQRPGRRSTEGGATPLAPPAPRQERPSRERDVQRPVGDWPGRHGPERAQPAPLPRTAAPHGRPAEPPPPTAEREGRPPRESSSPPAQRKRRPPHEREPEGITP